MQVWPEQIDRVLFLSELVECVLGRRRAAADAALIEWLSQASTLGQATS